MRKKKKHSAANGRPQTKSAAVRQYKAEHPRAKTGEIVAALSSRGVTISPGHVAAAIGRKRRARTSQAGDALALLMAAKRFIGRAGGIDSARSALRALEMLTLN
jgi:hypothetical protein